MYRMQIYAIACATALAVLRAARVNRERLIQFAILAVVIGSLGRLALVSVYQLRTTVDLAYESPITTSIQLIQSGGNPYDPARYAAGLHTFTMYTPAYHYLAALFPQDAANPFFWGRILALVFMLGAAAVLLMEPNDRASLERRLLLVALFLLCGPVTSNCAFLKTDSMALFFSVWAVHIMTRETSRRAACLVAVLCTAAFMTKQSYLAAGVICGATAILRGYQRATFFSVIAILGAGIWALARNVWGDGFWFCILKGAQNQMAAEQAWEVIREMLPSAPFVVAPVMLYLGFQSAWKHVPRVVQIPAFSYCVLTWLLFFATIPKFGSSVNYIFEPLLATFLWLSHLDFEWQFLSKQTPPVRFGIPLAIAAAFIELTVGRNFTFASPVAMPARKHDHSSLRAEVARIPAPPDAAVLNLHDGTYQFAFEGPVAVNDPFLYKLLWRAGRLDPAEIETALRARRYRCVLLPPEPLYYPTDSPRFRELLRVAAENYPHQRKVAGVEVAAAVPW